MAEPTQSEAETTQPEERIEERAREIESHLPEGMEAPREFKRLSVPILLALSIIGVIAVGCIAYWIGGGAALGVAIVFAALYGLLGAVPVWVGASLRRKEEAEAREKAARELEQGGG